MATRTLLAVLAELEHGGDGRRVLVDDQRKTADGAPVCQVCLDRDRHMALILRARRRIELNDLARRGDGAAGEHVRLHLVPG